MDVNELNKKTNITLLDAREIKEYEISHLKNALSVGYDDFDIKKTSANLADKNSIIVVYCSVGIRSEDIAEKLQKAGYKNVYNLYGGIFEWKNNGYLVYDKDNQETEKVHTFNKEWSKWLIKGEKIYE
jgi:rhodanese-related sulfurtransferase